MSRCCRSCAQDFEPGQEICPHCLASLTPVECLFTVEIGAPLKRQGSGMMSAGALPDLDAIEFQPSSRFYKAFSQLRGSLISAMIAVLCVGICGAWWVQSHRAQGSELSLVAEEAFERRDFAAASEAWASAFDAYDHGFDEQGQVSALVGLSRCHIRTKDFRDALVVLQRAQKIGAGESVDQMLRKCHRMAAVEHLERAQILFEPGTLGKSYLESELAIDSFEKGEGTGAQKAAANRMAARCSLELEDFEGAQSYLDKAFENEGDSKQNIALQAESDKAHDRYQSQTVADIGKDGYIPQGKLDPIAIQRAAGTKSLQSDRYPRHRYDSNRYTSNRPVTRRPNYFPVYQPPPKRIQTTLGTSASYPTHNPVPTYPSYQGYRATTWSGQNSSSAPRGFSYYNRASRTNQGYNSPNRSNYSSPVRLPGYSSPGGSVGYPTTSRYR